MFRNQSTLNHDFAMVPRADIPRSRFDRVSGHKTTFDAGYLVPVYCEEVLPGDTFSVDMTAFARLATPLYPIMDNMYLESFFFFVPNRLVWSNWVKLNGQQTNPGDSISYVVPQVVSPVGGYAANSIYDYYGLPTSGQVGAGNTVSHSALPLRGYNLIWNEWYRDENLQLSEQVPLGDGPDSNTFYNLLRRGKRHDYFTSALPWPQKGNTAVTLPLGTTAPVKTLVTDTVSGAQQAIRYLGTGGAALGATNLLGATTGTGSGFLSTSAGTSAGGVYPSNLYADLSAATAATINSIRAAFQTQRLLERDARGGTRYTEILRSHFGVVSPDARLQRPEYLGGGMTPVSINPIAQTSGTSASGTTTPLGNLAAMGTVLARNHRFSKSFVEHGYIHGFVSVRADMTYQQGIRKHWLRSTRYDFYWPVFAHLGEQAILNKEIYCDGSATDNNVFGYQERWAEYRYRPSQVSGLFKSTYSTPLDAWHLAQKFNAVPTLNSTFISENPPVSRIVAVGTAANGQQFLFDSTFRERLVRPMPMYSVPGLIDHF